MVPAMMLVVLVSMSMTYLGRVLVNVLVVLPMVVVVVVVLALAAVPLVVVTACHPSLLLKLSPRASTPPQRLYLESGLFLLLALEAHSSAAVHCLELGRVRVVLFSVPVVRAGTLVVLFLIVVVAFSSSSSSSSSSCCCCLVLLRLLVSGPMSPPLPPLVLRPRVPLSSSPVI